MASVTMDVRRLRRNARIEEAPLQGELMLFDPTTSRFFILNRTMAYVWRKCDGAHELAQLVDGLSVEFAGVDRETAVADLRQALGELMELELLVDSPEAGK